MDLDGYVEHFRARVLQDAFNEAKSSYWLRRAQQFEDARPGIGDFHGNQTTDQLRARWYELTGIATACRNRASGSLFSDGIEPDVIEPVRGAA